MNKYRFGSYNMGYSNMPTIFNIRLSVLNMSLLEEWFV